MISSERTQDAIVAITIIATIISSMYLVNNAVYYTGTYTLIGRLNVTFEELIISNLDPLDNESYPHLQFRFNMATESNYEGNVRITYMRFIPSLNDDQLSYTQFWLNLPRNEQYLTPDFNRALLFDQTAFDELGIDRQAILDAYDSGVWFWQVEFGFSYIFFDDATTIQWSFLDFNITEVTIV